MPPAEYDPRHFREANLAPTDAKRQHYVPRHYLDNFAMGGELGVFDVDSRDTHITSPINAAVETYFYDLRYEQEKLSTEDWFANVIEGPFWPLLWRLRDDPDAIVGLSARDEMLLARYVAAQRLRVPDHRQYIERTRRDVRKWTADMLASAFKRPVTVEEVDRYVADNMTLPWLRHERTYQVGEATSVELGEITGDANILIAKPWRIGRACSSAKLFTSDNPIAAHIPAVLPDWWSDFEDIEHYFPLAPELLLLIGAVSQDADSIPARGARHRQDFSRWETSRARSIVVCAATRWVYGSPPYISRELAIRNVNAFDDASRDLAVELSAYNPRRPQQMPAAVIKLVPPGHPDI